VAAISFTGVALRVRADRDDAQACGTSPGAGGACLRTGLFVPAEHAQGAEGVPTARPALALVRLDGIRPVCHRLLWHVTGSYGSRAT
jgi:hypothetical protein